jgi:hypothetical protein
VNGQLELEGEVKGFKPIHGGQTSIGVRQNKVHWYKGTIAKVIISPNALSVKEMDISSSL